MAAETVDQPRLLIVDDAPQNLRLLNGLLRGNYRVSVAVSGREALELAAARPPARPCPAGRIDAGDGWLRGLPPA